DLGLGFYQEMGWLLGEDGAESSEHDMLTALPLTFGATIRLDLLDEQVVVPTASIGGDYWLWRENWYLNADVEGDSAISGGKTGWHFGLGAQLLLDRFEPARASALEAGTGIDDTYAIVEWRRQDVGKDGLSFSGDAVSFGLKFTY
ncbi:MAG: hypothetical protein QGG40_16355, partial [Myxococcota bacterium]|nr:hypothetical protein [Myxococcota bacterium]